MKLKFARSANHRSWPAFKILLALVFTLAVFAGGFRVGRGNWDWNHSLASTSSSSTALNYSSLDQVYKLLKNDYNGTLDTPTLIDGAKAGLVNAIGDPYTEYFNPTDAKDFNNQLSNSIDGIGAELSKSGNNIIIMSPLSGYPAAKAGLQSRDVILAVDKKVVTGMDLQQVVTLIRGPVNSKVTLTIVRGNKQFNVTVVRKKISLPDVNYKVIGKVGYMQVVQFSNNTTTEARKAASAFKKAGVKAIILDLRDNPGGYLQGAVDLSSLWLKEGQEVVQERRGSQPINTLYAEGGNAFAGLPTIVLVNGGSASASEITSAALRDNGDASLLGTQSFGKGSVQQLEQLKDGSELKVTVALWYTPKGININKKGLKPDTVVPISQAQLNAGQDTQKDKALQILNAKIQ